MSRTGRGNRRTAQDAWPDGYMAAKVQKLALQFQADNRQFEQLSEIFKGVAIHVNGYTQPSADELRRLIGVHGGGYLNYFIRGENHYVICCNLSNAKKSDWLKFAVRPEWIVDSIASKKRLPVADYYLEKKRTVFDYHTEAGPSTSETSSLRCPTISDLVIGKDAEGAGRETLKPKEPKTASDVGFVEKFFKKSRLSFIATMKVKMQEYLKTIKENTDHNYSGREILRNSSERNPEDVIEPVYLHIDMDCFFASVAVRNRPELKDKPVAVCSNLKAKRKNQDPNLDLTDYRNWSWQDASTAEISCCNYAAREFGVHASMFLGKAQAMCPNLVVLPYDFEGFEKVSKCLYDTVASLTLNIEATSVDELFADVSEVLDDCQCSSEDIGKYLKERIFNESACTCTVGMGPNMLIARLATKKAKPDGFCHIRQNEVLEFMRHKSVSDIPGIGGSTEHKLRDMGIVSCLDFQRANLSELKELLGANQAVKIVELSKGVCTRSLKEVEDVQRKNISVEINYGMRFKELSEVRNCLEELSHETFKRLSSASMAAEILRLRILIRHPDAPEETMKYLGCGMCDQLTKSENFKVPLSNKDLLVKRVWSLYEKLNPLIKDIRGMGITLSKLSSVKNVPKMANLDAFLEEKPPANNDTKPIVSPPGSPLAPLEIYVYSSEENSDEEIIFEFGDEPAKPIEPPKRTLNNSSKNLPKSKKLKTVTKSKNLKGQLDIRKLVEFGNEVRGLSVVPPKDEAFKTEPLNTEPKHEPVEEISKISFGPKKFFHMNKLLVEWIDSGDLNDEDITCWIDALKKVALVDPRSSTILLRTLYRLAPASWSKTCQFIRNQLQTFVNQKLASGEIQVKL